MSYVSDVRSNVQQIEYQKFVQINDDARFPPISVIRNEYADSSTASVSSLSIYPKTAVLTYLTNASDIKLTLSASEVDIGNVGLVDHYTTGFDTYTSVIYTNTAPGGQSMGAVSVKTYGVSPVSGLMTVQNPVTAVYINGTTGVSGTVTIQNPASAVLVTNTVSISTSQALPISGTVTIQNPASAVYVLGTAAVSGAVTVISPVTSVQVYTNSNTLAVSGNTAVTNTVAISTTQTLPVSVVNPTTSMNVTVVNPTSAAAQITYADSVQLDQASRLRVAGLQNQWWYTSSVDKDGDVRYNEDFVNVATPTFVHGASSRFVQNLASINLTSGLSATGSVIRASRRRHKIIPGLSHEYTGTWNFDGQQTNVIKRMGIFTNFNGYFFELSGANFNVVVRRRLPDGTLVEERVERADWNGDKLNGTGPSGENWAALTTIAAITGYVSTTPLNIGTTTVYNVVYGLSAGQANNFRQGTKATFSGMSPVTYNQVGTIIKSDTTTGQLTANYVINPNTFSSLVVSPSGIVQTAYHMQHTYWIDFMGGRTNRVRFGKASDYGNIVLHTFRFDGLLGTAYENAPALMDRKEILNTGAVSGTPSFTVMGNSFNIEAEASLSPNFTIASNNNGVTFPNTAGAEYPILGVGLRTGEPFQRADLQIQSVNLIDTANAGAGSNQSRSGTFAWRLLLNPGLSGAPAPLNVGKCSRHWEYTTATKLTGGADGGGIQLLAGYMTSITVADVKTSLNFLNMGSNIAYTDADKVVLVVKQIGTAADNAPSIVASMNMIEAL
jgi:hypothetical protein